jgi:two-component system, NtrC family, response regulator HydG
VEGATRRAEAAILRYPWTGNVRELENVIGYACMMADGDRIDACDLPENFAAAGAAASPGGVELVSMDEIERRHARRVLDAVGGDKVRAAEILSVSRATLYRLLGRASEA